MTTLPPDFDPADWQEVIEASSVCAAHHNDPRATLQVCDCRIVIRLTRKSAVGWLDKRIIQQILLAVAEVTGVTMTEIHSDRQTARVTLARQIAMFLAMELSQDSVTEISRQFGRDHSTVSHGAKVIAGRIKTNRHLARTVAAIRQQVIGNGTVTG